MSQFVDLTEGETASKSKEVIDISSPVSSSSPLSISSEDLTEDLKKHKLVENIEESDLRNSSKRPKIINEALLTSKILKESQTGLVSFMKILYPNSLEIEKKYNKNQPGKEKFISFFNSEVIYISQQGSYGSAWSCGFRNIQMMSSTLFRDEQLGPTLFGGQLVIPTVKEIQKFIENAWKAGYDVEGGQELNNKLVGTSTWIGATECAALFRSFGLRAIVVDFPFSEEAYTSSSIKNMNSANPLMPGRVSSWIKKYFLYYEDKKRENPDIFVSPLYFQHMGHSMSIVGIEYSRSEGSEDIEIESLLIFDPDDVNAKVIKKHMEKISTTVQSNKDPSKVVLPLSAHHQWKKVFVNNISKFCKSNYQIVYIAPGLMDEEEREKSKTIRGHREHLPIIDTMN